MNPSPATPATNPADDAAREMAEEHAASAWADDPQLADE